jgi:hypothetical protein
VFLTIGMCRCGQTKALYHVSQLTAERAARLVAP